MKNIWLNMVLFALIVIEISYLHMPKILHEVLGIMLAVMTVIHILVNRRRLVLLTKNVTARKIFSLTVVIAMMVCMSIIFVSGILVSNYLFTDFISFDLHQNITMHQLHLSLPYIMMILVSMHIGLHLQELTKAIKDWLGLSEFGMWRRIIFTTFIAVMMIGGEVWLILNRVADRIAMKHIFGTAAATLPPTVFVLMIVGTIILFAAITFVIDKKFLRRR
ncbi:MAG: hypothetical protein K6G55_08650 [Selenomonadaceae bacterium]|nr:hypothetical protein [Selenomonadaceae bacterium]